MEIDWATVGPAIAAWLAFLASIGSAVAAARSADHAGKAEERTAAAERQTALRELRRSAAMLDVEVRLTNKITLDATQACRSSAVATGGLGGSREKLLSDQLAEQRERLRMFMSYTNFDPEADMESGKAVQMQLMLDEALIKVRAEKEEATRTLETIRREQELLALKPLPHPPR